MLECKTGIRTVFTNASGSIRNCEREKLRVKRWVTPNSNFYYTFEFKYKKVLKILKDLLLMQTNINMNIFI